MHKITLYIDFNIANMQIICKIYERYMHKYAKKIMLKLCTKYIECAQLYVLAYHDFAIYMHSPLC